MRLPLLAIVALVALPTAAGAKEITGASVCGPNRCTRLTDRASLDAFMHAGGMAEAAPSTPQRSYLVRIRVSEPDSGSSEAWTNRWLPDAGLMAARDDTGGLLFSSVEASLERVLRRAARGHAAYPARRFVRHDPEPRVVEVVEAPAAASRSASAGSGGGPWWLVAAAAGALALLGAAAAVRARRR